MGPSGRRDARFYAITHMEQPRILPYMACPACKAASLRVVSREIRCSICPRAYPVAAVGGEDMANWIPDDGSAHVNPVIRLWRHLMAHSSKGIDALVKDPHIFDFSDTEYASYRVSGARILDVGGNGGELRRYLDSSQEYVCLEPDPSAYARRNVLAVASPGLEKPFTFVRGVAEYMPFRAASFDAVVMHSVLEHLFDLNMAFGEAYRVMRSGGLLFIASDFHGAVDRSTRVSPLAKFVRYVRGNGSFSAVRRAVGRIVFNIRRTCNPWRAMVDFSEPQLESGHVYDNLTGDDILDLAGRASFELKRSFPVGTSTIFIFSKKQYA